MSGSVQKPNTARGFYSICPILGTTPFGQFVAYQTASSVVLPHNVTAGTAGCNPNVNTFNSILTGQRIPVCCKLDDVFANSFNIEP